jgi:hypothetical protein
MFSTGRAGVFLLPLAVLLPIGIYQAATQRRTPFHVLLLAGFLAAPLPALIVTDENAPIFRALALVPFGVLLAMLGLQTIWASRRARPVTWLAVVGLLLLLPLQFRIYASDYFNEYRVRASPWLGGNIRGALETLIDLNARTPAPALYFSKLQATSGLADGRNEYMSAYWQFYATKHGREDLLDRPRPLDPSAVGVMPAHSLVLANIGDRVADGLVASGQLRQVAVIPELDRAPFFEILER